MDESEAEIKVISNMDRYTINITTNTANYKSAVWELLYSVARWSVCVEILVVDIGKDDVIGFIDCIADFNYPIPKNIYIKK